MAEAMGLSAVIGEPIVGTYLSGGGIDGSLMQAKGLLAVDSLGLNGGRPLLVSPSWLYR